METADVEETPPTLEADCVYVQMKKQYRVSRYIRAQWFVSQIGKTIQPKQTDGEICGEVQVLSVLPRVCPAGWRPDRAHEFAYQVTAATKVTFLAKKYRFVFCLDLSASVATVDIRSETLLFDEVFLTLSQCVKKLVMPFHVPGSRLLFQPEIYVTVIAYIPHYTPAVQQVLIQGWPLTSDNCDLFLTRVSAGLREICIVLAEATAGVAELHDQLRLQSEKLTGGLFEETEEQAAPTPLVNMVSSDVSTLNMLKYGMLALQLLPENSSAGIVVITDGVISLPSGLQLESLLGSLRSGTVACSFLELGGRYHAKSCLGYVPYDDLMRFIARATFGAFLDNCLCPDEPSTEAGMVNMFHRALLFWSFQEESINRRLELARDTGLQYKSFVEGNAAFEQVQGCVSPLRKKNSDGVLTTSLSSILSCKLREGYALRSISTAKGELEIKLVLPWKFDVNLEYVVMVPWPASSKSRESPGGGSQQKQRSGCKFEVYVEASYDFLHDVTCEYFKGDKAKSPFRVMVAQQYWNALKNISSTDQLLVHLHSFNQNPVYYSVPESFRNGVPLFVLPHSSVSGHPVPSSNLRNNSAYAPFVAFWKPVCMLDINIWQRWMHVHRVGLLLEHDLPLPRYLQQPNSSGRYDPVQCRQALNRLAALLRDRASFVLADGHSYVTFLYAEEGDKPPVSFYITRVTYKAPCMVIRFAFLGGTPGDERNAIVKELTDQILSLEVSKRLAKDTRSDSSSCIRLPGSRTCKKASCCILFRKPLERILIRHEKMPRDVLNSAMVVPDTTALLSLTHPHQLPLRISGGPSLRKGPAGEGAPGAADPTSQLSRYLHHRRWIWTVQRTVNVPLPLHSVTRVLMTLAKMRLEEGFHFAHSSSGILNMALEIEMKNTVTADPSEATLLPCVVQYVLFPPYSNTTIRESLSDDEDNEVETAEADGELQLVTECWVEPQCGVVVTCPVSSSYLQGKEYADIPKALFEMDFECLSSLVTLEHLNLSCTKPELLCPSMHSQRLPPTPPVTPTADLQPSVCSRSTPDVTLIQNLPLLQPVAPEPTVSLVPFSFSIMKLLSKCQQTEILFSTFVQELDQIGNAGCVVDGLCKGPPVPNDLLYDQLLESLASLHDHEVPLSHDEHALLPHEIHNRSRDVNTQRVPFDIPPIDCPPVQWRCFITSFSGSDTGGSPNPNSHVALTFLPASYSNLQRLMMPQPDNFVHDSDLADSPSRFTPPRHYSLLHTESSSDAIPPKMVSEVGPWSPVLVEPPSRSLYKDVNSVDFAQCYLPPTLPKLAASRSDPVLATASGGAANAQSLRRQRSVEASKGWEGAESHWPPRCFSSTPCPDVTSPDQQKVGAGRSVKRGSVTLPVYVYDAPVSAVISRLVYQGGVRQWKDTYLDLTQKADEERPYSTEPNWMENKLEGFDGSCKTVSPEPKSDDSEFGGDRFLARKHCSRLRKAFTKSFVYGVFRALRDGLPVDIQDVNAVVEDACDETVLAVDITEFLQSICGHTRDFRIKTTVEHSHRTSSNGVTDSSQQMTTESSKDLTEMEPGCYAGSDGSSSLFPVDLLERHHPCELVQQLHLSVKRRFQQLLEEVFQRVPSHPDYYYFCPPRQPKGMWGPDDGAGGDHRNHRPGSNLEEEGVLCDWDDTNSDRSHNVEFSMDAEPMDDPCNSADEAHKNSGMPVATSGASCSTGAGSATSRMSAEENDNDDDEEEMMETIREAEPLVPPLFAHLTCLVQTGSTGGTCSLTSLPTCLGEVIHCLDNSQPTVDLENVKIRLDFLCLTLPPDVERLSPSRSHLSPSFLNYDANGQHAEDDAESIASLSYQLESPRDPLHHLPEFQNQVISKCIEKMKWMLRDEMASAALGSFPLTAGALQMVAEHVQSTERARSTTRLHAATGAPGCQVQKVPLQFVFGPDQSFEKFLQEFKLLSHPGYRLEQVDKDFYCLVLDDKDSKVIRRPFGSLVPPLGISSKALASSLECDDDDVVDRNSRSVRQRGSKLESKFSDEDKSETNDNSARQTTSFRTWRRQMGRSARAKSTESRNDRAFSVPLDPSPAAEEPKVEVHTPGQSYPSELLDLCRSLKGEPQGLNEGQGMSTETITQEHSAPEEDPPPVEDLTLPETSESFRDRTDSLASSLGHSMGLKASTHVLESTRSTPNALSEPEAGGQVSNTEDGYEGDSSESDNDRDWMSAIDTQRPHLPPFWLILCPFQDRVDVFFHVREQPEESVELKQGLVVFESIVGIIQDTCKIVNQILLLQHLNNTRMCNRLLVPEAAEDIWSRDAEIESMNAHHSLYDGDGQGDGHGDYLEATLKFKPGAFDCSVVWSAHFSLHPRLNTGPGRSGISRGLQALRAVLTGFSVNNRKNMFVYRENSGSVFYLRLHETQCHGRHGRADDDISFSGSRSSSLVSLVQKKPGQEQDEELEFRPRLSSGHSDRDQSHDTVSVTSHASGGRSKPQQCVVMHVHGIVQPGFAIKEDLVTVMQNKLDDAVLEVLTTTLARNPSCNLTLDDVQFIQKPQREPTTQLYCTVQGQLLPYLQAMLEYLRQDLHTFLHTPKYTDPKPENHFKPYVEHAAHALCHKDEDVFLFNRYKAMGTPSNGIACIILSLVDAQGRPVQSISCSLPEAGAFSGTEAPSEFREVSFQSHETISKASSDGTPGPMAMIRFQVWCVGKDYLEQLVKRMQNSVQHAYWDVLMEYQLLTCPIFQEVLDEPACFSEPPTPVKVRRTGRMMAEQARDKPFLFGMFASRTKEMSSSVPDMTEKVKSPKENSTEFNFSDALFSDVAPSFPGMASRAPGRSMDAEFSSAEDRSIGGSRKLHPTFHHAFRTFLEEGVALGVPSLAVHRCSVKARRAVPLVLRELQLGLGSLAPEISLTMFVEESRRRPSRHAEFVHFNPLTRQSMFPERYTISAAPGSSQRFIVVGRDELQWKAFMGISNLSSYLESSQAPKSHKSTQLFEPYLLTLLNTLELPVPSRTPGTPMSAPPINAGAPERGRVCETEARPAPALIPRQRLLFLVVNDKALTLYLYNWTSELSQELFRLVSQLVEWQDLREDFLRSIVSQKLGLFFNQPLGRSARTDGELSCPRNQLGGPAPTASRDNPLGLLEHVISRHHPPGRHHHSQDAPVAQSTRLALLGQVGQALRGARPRWPMQRAPYAGLDDPVTRHGRQVLEIRGLKRRELVEFHRIYDDKGTCANLLVMEKMLTQVKREARLVHFCHTPLLFSPTWRLKVAQVRDHTLDLHSPLSDLTGQQDQPYVQRQRHSSGGSQKSVGDAVTGTGRGRGRVRRSSGIPTSSSSTSGQSSPRHRRSTNEETWHMTVCSHYIQEYIQYLQNLGFMAIQTKHTVSRKSSAVSVRRRESDSLGCPFGKKTSVGTGALSLGVLPHHCLFQWHLGGLYFFEVGFWDPYVTCNLFLVERQRLLPTGTTLYMSQVTSEFIEDMDKIRVNMHMHSFTYDYHLRTIHSYVSGQQLLFKHGYHLTSFLDDFVKYYQKSPNYARNLIHAGSVVVPSLNVAPNQLYNYIIGHNKLYGMKVIRMVPVVCDNSTDLDTEYALVEISNKKVSYRDANDVQQTDNFFVGILTIHDTSPTFVEHGVLCLSFYILLTSQRELFPKFTSAGPRASSSNATTAEGQEDGTEGCFRPVRALSSLPGASASSSQSGSGGPSRRTSQITPPSAAGDRARPQHLVSPDDVNVASAIPSVASSGSISSSNAGGNRSRKGSFRGICEEEVAYLGYYSCHETLMQKVMSEQATAVTEHLKDVVAKASLHCRRDYLWKCLTCRHKSSDDASSGVRENTVRPILSYAELTELLGYVVTAPLDEADPQLAPLMSMHFAWYQGLLKVLVSRYSDNHCLFASPDNMTHHVVVMSPSCADSFMLLTTNAQISRADLRLVHREKAQHERAAADKSSSCLPSLYALVEDFVSTCCFHLWAGMLT